MQCDASFCHLRCLSPHAVVRVLSNLQAVSSTLAVYIGLIGRVSIAGTYPRRLIDRDVSMMIVFVNVIPSVACLLIASNRF